MRTRFDQQLEKLHVELIKMGSLCEQAITLAASSLEVQEDIFAFFHNIHDLHQLKKALLHLRGNLIANRHYHSI